MAVLWASGITVSHAAGGISVGTTRVVYDGAGSGVAVRVLNSSDSAFLIQSWIDSYKGAGGWENPKPLPAGTFVVTPPLFRLDKGENSVRIQRAGGDFPTDRESVFALNIKAIPSAQKPDPKTNYVQFAFVNSLKLFFRPAGLAGNPADAYKQLTFALAGGKVVATNPTPYHITLNKLSVGAHAITDPDKRMIPPLGTQSWDIPLSAFGSVTLVALNDFGGLTPPLTVQPR